MSHLNKCWPDICLSRLSLGFRGFSLTQLFFFFFFRNLVSLSKHCSFFQPVEKLKWCFLPPKLTIEEPKQCLGKEAERSPFFQFQIQQKWCAVLTDLHALLPTARHNYLPCLGAALHTSQGFWFCVCVRACVCSFTQSCLTWLLVTS